VLVGACFPVAVRWLGAFAGPTRASGLLLAAATAGSMVGALVASFVTVPLTGVQGTLAMALFLHAVLGSLSLSFLGAKRRAWQALRKNERQSLTSSGEMQWQVLSGVW